MPNKSIIVPFVLGICFISRGLHAGHDTSLRLDQNFYGTIDERFLLVSYLFHQINDDVSDYDYIEFGTGLQYQSPAVWLSFLVFYQQSYTETVDEGWLVEHKPSVNVNTSVTYPRVRISDQIRYEYRFTPEWRDYRIKNYLKISLHDTFLRPYAGWELYYEDHEKAIVLHRILLGISERLYGSVYPGIYYRVDIMRIEGRWEFSRQLIGLQVTIRY